MPFPVTLNGRTYTAADFDGQAYVVGLPDALQDFVTHAASLYTATSTTSVAIGTGSKSFTVQTGKPYQVGTVLRIASTASPSTNWMDGVVTSYTSGTGALVVNVTGIAGSGTLAAWSINLTGGGYAVGSPVTIAQGGTGATTAAAALTALGAVPLAGGTLTGALTLSGDPTADLHPASKRWAEQRMAKDSCRVASTANVTLATPGTAIDGVTLTNGDRVMLKNQTATAENGIWIFNGSATAMTRTSDMDTWTDVIGATTGVEEGTTNANTHWLCTSIRGGTLGTTAITWQLISNAQVAALGAISSNGLVNRTGAATFSAVTVATASTASAVVQRDASSNITINGVVTGAGTVTEPAIRPSADTNTGIRFPGSDVLHLVTGGTDRVSINAGGDINIGGATAVTTADVRYFYLKGPNAGLGYSSIRLQSGLSGNEATIQTSGTNADLLVSSPNTVTCTVGATLGWHITSGGHTLVGQNGTTTPGYSGNTTRGMALWNTGRLFLNAETFSHWNLETAGTLVAFTVGSAGAAGHIAVTSTTTSYTSGSDYRLKENVVPLTGALDRVALLNPKRFNFIAEPDVTMDGFLAHEVADVVPIAVSGEKDAEDSGGNPIYQGLDQSKLVPLLVAAVQELRAEFNTYMASHP